MQKLQNELVILSLALLLCLGCIFPRDYFSSVSAKSETRKLMHEKYIPKDFKVYKNADLGFTISYPSDWLRVDKPLNVNTLVSFYSPRQGPLDKFSENLVVSSGKFDKKISPNKYIDSIIGGIRVTKGITITELNQNYTVSGKNAFKVVYSTDKDRNKYVVMVVGLLVDFNFYLLTYTADLSSYAEFFDTVNRMISSVRISPSLDGQEPNSFSSFHDANIGVSIQYPSSWTVAQKGYLSSNLTIYPPLDNLADNYFDNLRIYVSNLNEKKPSLDSLYKAAVGDMQLKIKNFTLVMSGNVNIGNLSGMGLVFKFPSGNTTHESLFIFTLNKNRLYTTTFDTTPKRIGYFVPIVYKILSTVKID